MQRGSRSIGQAALDLDVTESALRRRVEQAEVDAGRRGAGALTSAEREELTQLRRETRRLTQERDFLKKAAAFFASETDRSSK
jgi:transposase